MRRGEQRSADFSDHTTASHRHSCRRGTSESASGSSHFTVALAMPAPIAFTDRSTPSRPVSPGCEGFCLLLHSQTLPLFFVFSKVPASMPCLSTHRVLFLFNFLPPTIGPSSMIFETPRYRGWAASRTALTASSLVGLALTLVKSGLNDTLASLGLFWSWLRRRSTCRAAVRDEISSSSAAIASS